MRRSEIRPVTDAGTDAVAAVHVRAAGPRPDGAQPVTHTEDLYQRAGATLSGRSTPRGTTAELPELRYAGGL